MPKKVLAGAPGKTGRGAEEEWGRGRLPATHVVYGFPVHPWAAPPVACLEWKQCGYHEEGGIPPQMETQ